MKAPWSLVPMLFPLAAVVAGILLSALVQSPLWLLAGLVVAIIGFVFGWREVTIVSLLLTVGLASALIHAPGELPKGFNNASARYSGVVERVTESESVSTLRLTIDSVNHRAVRPFDASVVLPTFDTGVERLNRISLNCRLAEVEPTFDLPDEIDPRTLTGSVAGFIVPDSIKSVEPAKGWIYSLQRYRERVTRRIYSVGFSDLTAVFVNAILTGDSSDFAKDDRMVFARAGLSHILALSGLHVGVISWMIGLLLYPLFRSRKDPRRGAIVIAAVWLFAIVTGLSASVTRAAIMCSVVIIGTMLRRRHSPFNSLCLAATIILIADPQALFTAGFQLTFAAVAAIIAVMIPINRYNDVIGPYRFLLELVAVPIAATIGTCLISLYHFHTLPLHFLGANVLTAWLLPPLMVVAAIAIAFPVKPLVAITDGLFNGIKEIARFFSEMPGIEGEFYPTAAGTVLGVAAVCLIIFAAFRQRPAFAIMAGIALTGWAALEWQVRPDDPQRAVYFIRSHSSMDVAVRDSSRLIITTTAHRHEYPEVKERANVHYRRFMSRRGIDSVEVMRDFACSHALRHGDTLVLGSRSFLILTSSKAAVPTDWSGNVILAAGFKGDAVKLAVRKSVDTIIIGADINARRARRYERELRESGKPVVNLHNRPLSYTSY